MSDIIIVGAGLAGLSCALRLQEAGVDYTVCEASDSVGGRVKTESADGFLFDHGFQVLLTSYPEIHRWLKTERLQLKAFEPGALVYRFGRFYRLADPWRQPSKIIQSLASPLGTFADKARIARLRMRALWPRLDSILERPERATREALEADGFSDDMLGSFLEPFLKGIFLDPELATSSRKFDFLFRMFSTGAACIPAGGMGKIPESMAGRIPPRRLRLSCPVESVEPGRVRFKDGNSETAKAVVIAVDPGSASRFLGTPPPKFKGSTTLYYSARRSPVKEPVLVLDGEQTGPVNNLTVLTDLSDSYAPKDRALISMTVIGADPRPDAELDEAVRLQMVNWFGMSVADWRLRRIFRIREALPEQRAKDLDPIRKPARYREGLYVCGDYLNIASINGAMESGRLAAESLISDLGLGREQAQTEQGR